MIERLNFTSESDFEFLLQKDSDYLYVPNVPIIFIFGRLTRKLEEDFDVEGLTRRCAKQFYHLDMRSAFTEMVSIIGE